MEAYEQLGLLVASDEETMTTNMNTLLNDTESALATQGSVVARFNALAAATEAGAQLAAATDQMAGVSCRQRQSSEPEVRNVWP